MVYVHTILRDVAGLFKVGRLVAYKRSTWRNLHKNNLKAITSKRHKLLYQ